MSSCTIKVKRDGDLQEVNPKDLTNSELCHLLSELLIDSEFSTSDECHDWELAREEAVRRLKQNGETQDDVGQFYDAKPVVNAAKLREALDESRRIASSLAGCRLNDYWKLEEIVRVCDAALATPARNCDMGTAEEQRKRFGEFCQSHSWHEIDGEHCRASCPLYHGDKAPCDELEWAQMPYEEGGAK